MVLDEMWLHTPSVCEDQACLRCLSDREKFALVKALCYAIDEFQRMANDEIERVARDADFANRHITQLLTSPPEKTSK